MNNIEQQIYDKIVRANKEYRQGTPIMTDFAYDILVDELRSINPDHEWFKKVEPGMDLAGRKVKLPFPMRSLDKVKTFEELCLWFDKVGIGPNDDVVITPKYDGISLLCNENDWMTYSRGGNDNEGMDCKRHMDLMSSVWHQGNAPVEYTFGEAIIPKSIWKDNFEGKINPLNGQPYKSARNTVAGVFRRDDPPSELLKHVYFMRYGAFGEGVDNFDTYIDLLDHMEAYFVYVARRLHTFASFLNTSFLKELFDSWSQDFAIDGLVIYVNDMRRWKEIGRHSSTGNPQWAIAYKPEEFTGAEITTVQSVNCKVSKSGYLKPTVAVDAVELEGATINNPTGYNAKFCFDNGIGTGAEIKIIRSGMVIPKIQDVIYPVSNDVVEEAFKLCPSCGKETVWNDSLVERMCPDPLCPGRLLAKLIYFCEKLEYDEIGEETLKAIFNSGIESPGDLLHTDLSTLQKIDGIGYDTASKIIEKNRGIFDNGVSLPKLMEASDCFDGIGEKKATILLSNVDNVTLRLWISGELTFAGYLVMTKIMSMTKGVGDKMIDEFSNKCQGFVEWVRGNEIPIAWEKDEPLGTSLSGVKICFTGIRDKQLESKITKAGGTVSGSVSKNTTYLVADDINSCSSKAEKARALGIPIISICELNEKVNL